MKIKHVLSLIIIIVAVAGVVWLLNSKTNSSGNHSSTAKASAAPTTIPASDIGAELTKADTEAIAFSTDSLPVTVTKSMASPAADGAYLLANANRCGPPDRPASYFSDLVKTLDKLPKTVYTISMRTPTGTLSHYYVSVIPNLLGYKDLDSVQADFFVCKHDTDHLKPVQRNAKWIAFIQNCLPNDKTCSKIAEVVSPTIKLK